LKGFRICRMDVCELCRRLSDGISASCRNPAAGSRGGVCILEFLSSRFPSFLWSKDVESGHGHLMVPAVSNDGVQPRNI